MTPIFLKIKPIYSVHLDNVLIVTAPPSSKSVRALKSYGGSKKHNILYIHTSMNPEHNILTLFLGSHVKRTSFIKTDTEPFPLLASGRSMRETVEKYINFSRSLTAGIVS